VAAPGYRRDEDGEDMPIEYIPSLEDKNKLFENIFNPQRDTANGKEPIYDEEKVRGFIHP